MESQIPYTVRLRQIQISQMVVLSFMSVSILVYLVDLRNLPNFDNSFNSTSEKNISTATRSKQWTCVTAQSHERLDITTSFTRFLFKIWHVPKFDHAIFRNSCQCLLVLCNEGRPDNIEMTSQNILLLYVGCLGLFNLGCDLRRNRLLNYCLTNSNFCCLICQISLSLFIKIFDLVNFIWIEDIFVTNLL